MNTQAQRILGAIIALILCANSANAQWSMNGSKIYYSSGKVGIGTSNPNSPLTIVTAIGTGDRPALQVKVTDTDPDAFNSAVRGIHRGTGFNGIGVWGSHDGSGYGVYGEVASGGFGVIGVCNGTSGSGIYGEADGVNAHAGFFNGRVFASDNVGLGVADPAFALHLSTDSAAKPTSNTWTISSDRRLKKNIRPIDSALAKLMALRGVTYQWKNPESQGDMTGTYTGMIAQDVEKVFPEWVRDDADGYKTLTVIGFEGIVVEALRELRAEKDAEIEALHAANDSALAEKDAQIAALTARLEQLEQVVGQLVNAKESTP